MSYNRVHILDLASTAILNCSESEVYVRITKKTYEFADEESFRILDGTEVVYNSPPFVDLDERVLEICLPPSKDYQYTLSMHDSGGNSWTNGAWIRIQGTDENIAYMGMMSQKSDEDVPFSLLTPIHKGETWKFSTEFDEDWIQQDFDDSHWKDVITGSTSGEEVIGTQYFRKVFHGKPDMAAIEVQFQYIEGVIAYLNGVEIYRDNLPSGEILPTTAAIGAYTELQFHGQLRPSTLAESSSSILAVAIHFLNIAKPHALDFDSYLALDAATAGDGMCFATPFNYHIPDVEGVAYPSDMFNWFRQTYAFAHTDELPKTVRATVLSESIVPLVNGLRLWPSYSPSNLVNTFKFAAGTTRGGRGQRQCRQSWDGCGHQQQYDNQHDHSSDETWNTLLVVEGIHYQSDQYKDFISYQPPLPFQTFQLTLLGSAGPSTHVNGMPLVCNVKPRPFSYLQEKTQFYAYYDEVHFVPEVYGVENCTITPALPSGLSIHPQTCIIHGTATILSPLTHYTVTAQTASSIGTVQSELELGFEACNGTMLHFVRTYQSNAEREGFVVRDGVDQHVLLEVPIGHSQAPKTDHHFYLCITTSRYEIQLSTTGTYWMEGSYLTMYEMLPGGEETMLFRARYDAKQGTEEVFWMYGDSIRPLENWYYFMGGLPSGWNTEWPSEWSEVGKA